jgi:hypothetical protein
MATFNANSRTNNVNLVEWSYSTRLVWHTDRATSSHDRGAEVDSVHNLGVGVARGNPFTILA